MHSDGRKPVYVHCPLITDEEHKKLSKRSGHSSLDIAGGRISAGDDRKLSGSARMESGREEESLR